MIAYDKSEVAVRGEDLSEIWWQGRQWAVTAYGLERRDGTYFIDRKRLLQDATTYGWVKHIGTKNWADVDDFATAYLVAIAMHGCRLTKAMQARVLEGYRSAVVSHEKERLHGEMFPPTDKLELIFHGELSRRCRAVDAEYRRRKNEDAES
jgi:hypothetical protein